MFPDVNKECPNYPLWQNMKWLKKTPKKKKKKRTKCPKKRKNVPSPIKKENYAPSSDQKPLTSPRKKKRKLSATLEKIYPDPNYVFVTDKNAIQYNKLGPTSLNAHRI